MNTQTLQDLIVEALEDVKAKDIRIFNTEKISDQFERVIIASASSDRQTRALANSVVRSVREAKGFILGTEGQGSGEWVLVDCGNVVCHIFQSQVRDYYNLEELWGGAEITTAPSDECIPHNLVK